MAHRFPPAFLLLAVLFAVPSMRADGYFDYYMLSLMWPGAYCSKASGGCCKPTTSYPEKDFFITSFATFSKTTNQPVTECTAKPFNDKELDDVEHDLSAFWSSIGCPPNDGRGAWEAAWKTYGACTDHSQREYFRLALHARRAAHLLKRLRDRDIEPGDRLYNLAEVKDAVKRKLGVTPGIQCINSPYDIQGLLQIYQFFLCFSSEGDVMECPLGFNFTCSSYVQFMPFEYSMLKPSNSFDGRGGSNPIKMPASLH